MRRPYNLALASAESAQQSLYCRVVFGGQIVRMASVTRARQGVWWLRRYVAGCGERSCQVLQRSPACYRRAVGAGSEPAPTLFMDVGRWR
jgi:hypothetical protein